MSLNEGIKMITHGKRNTPTYRAWADMKARCNNPNKSNYKNYGGRGITYDPSWERFEVFLADMGMKPEKVDELSLERKDNDKNYCKDNCVWATRSIQNFNARKRITSKAKLKGIEYIKEQKTWRVIGSVQYNGITLYRGKDFFEACCARKSWENRFRENA
jgi:hypothetical protein